MNDNLTYCLICGIQIPIRLLQSHLRMAHQKKPLPESTPDAHFIHPAHQPTSSTVYQHQAAVPISYQPASSMQYVASYMEDNSREAAKRKMLAEGDSIISKKPKRARKRTPRYDFTTFCSEHVNVSECFTKDCENIRAFIVSCPDECQVHFCEIHNKLSKCFSSECLSLIGWLREQFSQWRLIQTLPEQPNIIMQTSETDKSDDITEDSTGFESKIHIEPQVTTALISTKKPSEYLEDQQPLIRFVKPAVPSTSRVASSASSTRTASVGRTLKSVNLERCDKVILVTYYA